MKIILPFIASILFSISSFSASHAEKGLPDEPDTTKVELAPITQGQDLTLNFHLGLPTTQKLNQGAPSFVGVYEKIGSSEWTETARIDLNKFFAMGNGLDFTQNVQLRSPISKVAVHSTIFHCGKDRKSACFIQGFQGIAKRAPTTAKTSKTLPFYIEGQMK
jgi:hypothetical protein